ncbi:MAG: GH92 family glycosyl hydrolase, partial [Acidobacteriota bacterium]|nr:GH92 family glycosyl hydrolase [Acidobacteriota bacterium]
SGSVTSGNFCGYINPIDRRSYYTLYFVAQFDRPFSGFGTWQDASVHPDGRTASGGTTYGTDGYPVAGRGSGAWVSFDPQQGGIVTLRVGVSYVSALNAAANLRAEDPAGVSFDAIRTRAQQDWNQALGRIQVAGGTAGDRTIFYTALYHALLQPTTFSDVNGEYRGVDQRIHAVAGGQRVQYANFSGWDVYRSQLQLVTLLDPAVGSDIAQSLLNQADQNGGAWDRWTHNSGATHVMEGDPSPAAVAGIYAFGGTHFDAKRALASLTRAATVPTPADRSGDGCPVECAGQRPSLDAWLKLHDIPAKAHAWGGAGETLEDATADFALSQLAARLGESAQAAMFRQRAGYWQNLFGPAGYVQDRNADGSWPPFDPASDEGFAEGSSAQYTWMVPFDAAGLFARMGGAAAAVQRLNAFFHTPDGAWALTGLGGMHAEMDNEPSTGAPWLYDFAGRPDLTEQTVREVMRLLWSDSPFGIPGNDDLGAMSAWYVWSALGMYPGIPGRAELLLASPLFPAIAIHRATGVTLAIHAPAAADGLPYVAGLRVNGLNSTKPWLPESFVTHDGELRYDLRAAPDEVWGRQPADAPPSFPPAPARP